MSKSARKEPVSDAASTPTLPDGRYFSLQRIDFTEARLIEVVVKNGIPEVVSNYEDMSRIALGRLVDRVSSTYGEKV